MLYEARGKRIIAEEPQSPDRWLKEPRNNQFRKQGCMPITIPKHEPIKKVYVEMVRQIVESEAKNDEDTE